MTIRFLYIRYGPIISTIACCRIINTVYLTTIAFMSIGNASYMHRTIHINIDVLYTHVSRMAIKINILVSS